MRRLLSVMVVTLAVVAPAAAQDYKPVDFNIGFGWTMPQSDLKTDFDAGWNGAFGVTFNMNEHVGVQAEYMYTHMNGPDKVILVSATPIAAALTNGLLQSNHQMHVGSFNLVYRSHSRDKPVGGYALGGVGIYHRIVQLTSPTVGYTTYCDPFFYVCYPAAVAVDQIIGDRSSNDFGIDFGAGLTFGHEAKFYIETRYHYVFGKTITPANGSTTTCPNGCSTSASYIPITFGVRW
jgi:opacity protein-like surface antigen